MVLRVGLNYIHTLTPMQGEFPIKAFGVVENPSGLETELSKGVCRTWFGGIGNRLCDRIL